MNGRRITRADRAQLAMMLEVCAFPKPGNVDRCHDYPETRLEHFLASTILARPALERAERGEGSIGELILDAVENTSIHSGGNTHFGAFMKNQFPAISRQNKIKAIEEGKNPKVIDNNLLEHQ